MVEVGRMVASPAWACHCGCMYVLLGRGRVEGVVGHWEELTADPRLGLQAKLACVLGSAAGTLSSAAAAAGGGEEEPPGSGDKGLQVVPNGNMAAEFVPDQY